MGVINPIINTILGIPIHSCMTYTWPGWIVVWPSGELKVNRFNLILKKQLYSFNTLHVRTIMHNSTVDVIIIEIIVNDVSILE